jgi:hypothetical protein
LLRAGLDATLANNCVIDEVATCYGWEPGKF